MKQLLIIFLFAATQVSAQMPKHPPRSVTTSTGGVTYATQDPIFTGADLALSNGNLTVTGVSPSGFRLSMSNMSVSTSGGVIVGCEWTVTNVATNVNFGVCKNTESLTTYLGAGSNGYCYNSFDGQKYNNATGTAYGATYTTGDVITVIFNYPAAGSITEYKNGTSQGTMYTGLSGDFFFAMSTNDNSVTTVNYGATSWTYPAVFSTTGAIGLHN